VSHDATAWAKAQKTGNSPAKFILLVLADFAGTDYSCYPSVKKLADITELSESTVRAATKLLAELGLIRVFYRHRENMTRRSSRYQLLVDGPDTMEPDAEDWTSHRRVSASQRQETAGTPQEPAHGHRRELALIPDKDPSLREPSVVIPGAARKATRIPENFQPDKAMRDWFATNRLGEVLDGVTEHEKFCDYWAGVPGVRGQKLDWPATWRVWMRNAADRVDRRGGFRPTSGAAQQYKSTTDQRVAQTLSMNAMFEEEDAR
jgi:hypothetical protein